MMWDAVKCFEYFEMFVRCCIPFEMLWVVLKCYDNLLDALRWFYMLLVVVRYCKLFEMLCVIVRWFELWIILRHCGLLWIVLKCCEILFRSCKIMWNVDSVRYCELLWVVMSCLWVGVRFITLLRTGIQLSPSGNIYYFIMSFIVYLF